MVSVGIMANLESEPLDQRFPQSPDLLASIIASAMDAIVTVDDAQHIVLFNATAERVFACPANEAIGSSIERFIPERFRPGHGMRVRRFSESGLSNRTLRGMGTLWGLRATGEEFPMEASISKAVSGGQKYFTVVIRDITERKRADEALHTSEERLRLAYQAARIGTFEWNIETGVNTWTPELEEIYGLPPGGFGGTQTAFEKLVHPDDRAGVIALDDWAIKTGQPTKGEWRVVWPDGSVHWIAGRWQVYMNESGEPSRMIGVNGDVTERKLAEQALRESEQRLRLATQVGRMYAYDWDVKTNSVVRSSEHIKVLGLKEPLHFPKQHFVEKILPDDRPKFLAAVAGLTPENPTAEVTYRALASDGTVVWLKSNGRGFFDAEGEMVRVIGMVADITDLKQAEESLTGMMRKLVEAQEQERARIGRELHDDINQRLALLAVELGQLQDDPSEIQSRVQELVRRVSEISNDVQALSHNLHASKLEYLGVVAGIQSWCKEFSERQKIEIAFQSAVSSVLAPEIGLTLFRVLQEALHNAIKHSRVKRIEVQLREDAGELHLVISDLGRGFDVKAASQGAGLGLNSMRERVRLVNGTIAIESKPMVGTTIHVRVPLDSGPTSLREAI